MSPITEIRLIVQRELLKNFRSIKGMVLAGLSILGGGSFALLLVKLQEFKRQDLGQLSEVEIHELREKALEKFYEPEMARSLAASPEVLLILLKMTIWLTPLLVALMGFDAISADLQHKSVRYWTLRTRRASYFIGKWFGLWATVSTVTFAMDAIMWIACIARGEATAATTIAYGMKFWLVSLPMSAVWCGISIFVSSLFRQPIIALLLTFAAFFVIWAIYGVGMVIFHAQAVAYVYPNAYDDLLLHPAPGKLATGLAACLGMAAAYIAGGSLVFSKRDV